VIPTVPYVLFCDFFYDFLSLKNDVNVALKSTVISKKLVERYVLVAILKVTDKNAGSGSVNQRSGSVPKCHGSAALIETVGIVRYLGTWVLVQ